jgi:hypothetical protein
LAVRQSSVTMPIIAASSSAKAASDHAQRQQPLAGRPDLNVNFHLGADPAVVARSPSAVVDLGGTTALLLLCVFTVVNIALLVLRVPN